MLETGRNLETNQLKVPMPLLERVGRLAVLGRYPFFFEETAEGSFDDLTERICAAVKPLNVIEEMFVADIVILQWEIAELRRVRAALIAVTVYEALKEALDPLVSYDLLADEFEQRLTEELQENASEDENEEFVENLVREYIDDQEGANAKVNEILKRGEKDYFCVYNSVRKHKVEALARSYAIRDYNAIKQVDEVLAANGLTVHEVTVKPIMSKIEELQRIDHLIASAENRRNTALHEIDRRWSRLGTPLRRNIEAQDAEFEVIQSEGKTVA